jgi:hypothetical protein
MKKCMNCGPKLWLAIFSENLIPSLIFETQAKVYACIRFSGFPHFWNQDSHPLQELIETS